MTRNTGAYVVLIDDKHVKRIHTPMRASLQFDCGVQDVIRKTGDNENIFFQKVSLLCTCYINEEQLGLFVSVFNKLLFL